MLLRTISLLQLIGRLAHGWNLCSGGAAPQRLSHHRNLAMRDREVAAPLRPRAPSPCPSSMSPHSALSPQRRIMLGTVAACTFAAADSAVAASGSPMVARVDALVWKGKSGGSLSGNSTLGGGGGCATVAAARAAFGPKFVNYLTRFLLAYDKPTRRLWRERAAEIPLRWSEERVEAARTTQLSELVGAVEAALCDFAPEGGIWAEPILPQEAAAVRRLLSLLRSRYVARPDALRQVRDSPITCPVVG